MSSTIARPSPLRSRPCPASWPPAGLTSKPQTPKVCSSRRTCETWVDEDGETRHELTEWGREAVAPLALAMRLECRHPREDTMAPDHRDAEAILGCALPLIQLDPRLEGSCCLAFRLPGARIELAGVTARFEAGQLREIGTDLEEPCDSAALASSDAWLEALASGEAEAIEVDGEPALAHGILEALHEQLFAGLPKL